MALHGKDTILTTGNMSAQINKETTDYQVTQDVTDILAQCKADREAASANYMRGAGHFKKAFSIPDIVAIEILNKYGIDVHCPMFMSNKDQIKKVYQIVKTEYPLLLCS